MCKRSGLLALALVFGIAGGEINAQCNGLYGGYGYGYWDIGRLYQVLSQNVPYYSAFPPVYYSVPVPRTYGYSPFAYPPGTMTPEVVETVPAEEIVNPYVEPTSLKSEPKAKPDRVTANPQTVAPLVVTNPFMNDAIVRTAAMSR